jgi:hypothetical protein
LQDADYSDIENSTLPLVQDNIDFLKYVHDNVDTIDAATLQTALDLFGDDLVYGAQDATFDFEKAYADLDALDKQIAAFEEQFLAQYEPAVTEAEPAAEAAEGEDTAEGTDGAAVPAQKTAAEALAEILRKKGAAKVATSNLCEEDWAEGIEDAFKYGKIVLAAPTYDGGLFPKMVDFIHHLKIKNYQKRRIALLENGFAPMQKPSGQRFDACSEGRLLLVAPWEHHNEQRAITREQCLALNRLADEITTHRG